MDTRNSPFELQAVAGPLTGSTFALNKSATLIGRGNTADIVVPNDRNISRTHARISCFNEQCYIEDNASMNGTFVNGLKVHTRVPLQEGDRVQVGVNHFAVKRKNAQRSATGFNHHTHHFITHAVGRSRPTSLMLKHSAREEHSFVTSSTAKHRPLHIAVLSLLLVAFVVTGVKRHFPQLSHEIAHQLPTSEKSEDAPIPEATSTELPADVAKALSEYQNWADSDQWDQALFTALWGVAWVPSAEPLQRAVSESSSKLTDHLYLLQRRNAVQQILHSAKDTYVQRAPIHVPLILTQALIDLKLTSGLAQESQFNEEIGRINHLARIEIERQITPELHSLEDLIQNNELESIGPKLKDLLQKYPFSTSLKAFAEKYESVRDIAAQKKK